MARTRLRPTAEQIEAGRTPAGGWTRETLRSWGVAWPPPKGWKARLISEEGPRIGDRVPMPPKPSLVVKPLRFVDDPARGPRGVFQNGGKKR